MRCSTLFLGLLGITTILAAPTSFDSHRRLSSEAAISDVKRRDLHSQHNRVQPHHDRLNKLVHLPLVPVPRRSDIHPLLLFQQHLNHAVSKHARMTRRTIPAGHLEERMMKRIVQIHGAESTAPIFSEELFEKMKKRYLRPSGGNPDTSSLKALNPDDDANTLSAAGGGAAGFSEAELQASISGGVLKSTPPNAQNSLQYNIEANDVGYLADVQLGTPPKTYTLLMDSGSADTWVPSQECTACGPHNTLGTNTSSTFKASTTPFSITYGSGAVQGTLAEDTMSMAGLSLPPSTFGVALQESQQFSAAAVPFDGLMGLAQSGLSEQAQPTPPEKLAAAGLTKGAIMSYDLGRVADGTNTGQITFGGQDSSRIDTAKVVTAPVVSTIGFWEVSLDDSTVDGKSTGLAGKTAILDTGTTLMIIPQADATAIHSLITGAKTDNQGSFTVPCTMTQSVALSVGGQSFAIDPRDITFLPVSNNDLTGDCTSGIQAGTVGTANEWLVGDVFLKNVIMTTDVASNTVTLSAKKNSLASNSTSPPLPSASGSSAPSGAPSSTPPQPLASSSVPGSGANASVSAK